MRNPFFPGVGGVLSADIAVPEHERELSFYAQVMTTGPTPRWRDDLTNNNGTPVIGLGERVPAYESIPLQWMPHFQVADVADSAKQCLELGGEELMHGRADDGQSQWAVLVDPAGAAFGVIPAVDEATLDPKSFDGCGRISWLSLAAADVASTCTFYERVVGWSAAPPASDGGCEMRCPSGVAAADIGPVNDDQAEIPAVWILSLPVGDLAESLRRARDAGGEVLWSDDGAGRAVIRDVVGVCIGLQSDG
ncbi:MAG: VOC family protein [Phycisphaerales bacterium]